MKHEIYLDFVIADFDDISADEILQRLQTKPRKVFIKGVEKYPNSKVKVLAKRSKWIVGSSVDKHMTFEQHLNAILDIIEPKINVLGPLCEAYNCFFSCAVYIDTDETVSTPSVYLDNRYWKATKQIKVDFDFDLYCLPRKDKSDEY